MSRINFNLVVAIVLAGVLFWGAVAKAWNPGPTVRVLILNWGFAYPASIGLVWAVAAIEFAIVSWILWTVGGRAALVAAGLFLLAISISPLLQWIHHDTLSCGCGLPEWAGHPWLNILGRNVPLAAAALGAAWPEGGIVTWRKQGKEHPCA